MTTGNTQRRTARGAEAKRKRGQTLAGGGPAGAARRRCHPRRLCGPHGGGRRAHALAWLVLVCGAKWRYGQAAALFTEVRTRLLAHVCLTVTSFRTGN